MKQDYTQVTQAEKDSWTTIKQFRKFFEIIPADKFCVDYFTSGEKCCVRGHLGVRGYNDGDIVADRTLLRIAHDVVTANNGYRGLIKNRSNRSKGIKGRVIKYLKSLEKNNAHKVVSP